ncbi:MAG: NAD(P)H-dependent oxidoreductase [Devosiaceae bacterium]|nr:NAD(P)H-dependent oxidoreductase [Devosiaceae bacterium]
MSTNKITKQKPRTLVLNGNPGKSSLCKVLAEAAYEEAQASGKEVRILHLSQMSFDPDLTEGFEGKQQLEPDLKAAQDVISWCDELIIVHPLWWGSAPAKLKGLFDRILLPGFAFRYNDGAEYPEKLLTGKTASVLITSDTPGWYLSLVYGNGWTKTLKKQILQFCGFGKIQIKIIGPIRSSTPDQRAQMILMARKLAA